MDNYCLYCDKSEDCEIANETRFCNECKHRMNCRTLDCCEAGYEIECNNGFEDESDEGEGEVE